MRHRKTDNLRTDCFAFKGCEYQQFCNALGGVKNCVGCNFFKTKEQIEKEEKRTKRRLEKLGAYYDLNKGRFVRCTESDTGYSGSSGD